uniref:Uncharacterized protein n=1 Tax=Rhizophora mucronata TaxID=61149 RepID=A0A2P2MJB3_RHIMU
MIERKPAYLFPVSHAGDLIPNLITCLPPSGLTPTGFNMIPLAAFGFIQSKK